METDGRRMCELLVGLGEVDLVGVEELAGDWLRVTIRSRGPRPLCEGCGVRSFVEQDLSVAPERGLLTSRAGRWATWQVGRMGRTVSEVAEELGCSLAHGEQRDRTVGRRAVGSRCCPVRAGGSGRGG